MSQRSIITPGSTEYKGLFMPNGAAVPSSAVSQPQIAEKSPIEKLESALQKLPADTQAKIKPLLDENYTAPEGIVEPIIIDASLFAEIKAALLANNNFAAIANLRGAVTAINAAPAR